MHLQFVQSESTFAYFNATQRYLEAHGKIARRAMLPMSSGREPGLSLGDLGSQFTRIFRRHRALEALHQRIVQAMAVAERLGAVLDAHNLTLEKRREVLESAFDRGLARSAALLEKDVWVVWTLQVLFAAPFADDLVFKDGTSQSKAYNIIQRFSEDVDLTYDIRKLANEQAGQPEVLTDAEAKSLGRRIREKLLPRLLETEIQPYLEAQIGAAGLQATVEREDENLFVVYEAAADYPAYVRPRVKLEFGARSTGEPATRLTTSQAAGCPGPRRPCSIPILRTFPRAGV